MIKYLGKPEYIHVLLNPLPVYVLAVGLAEWPKLSFPEHRSGSNINVSAMANAQQAAVVVTDEKRRELQERLEEWRRRLPATL